MKNNKSKKSVVYGWVIEDGKIIPVFNSEKNEYKNFTIYKNINKVPIQGRKEK